MQKRVPEEAPSHVLYRKFCTHFFDVAKKTAPECVCLRNLYTRASENASEKSAKKLPKGLVAKFVGGIREASSEGGEAPPKGGLGGRLVKDRLTRWGVGDPRAL